MQTKSSIKKKFFEDRPGIVVRSGLVYDNINERYTTGSIADGSNVSTAATQRLGQTSFVSEAYSPVDLENVGYPNGGTVVGSITVFTGSESEQGAEDLIDFYRYGKDIKDVKRYVRATTTIPMIRVGPASFFADEAVGTIDHELNFDAYGQGYLFLDVDESPVNQRIIPFNDLSKLVPSSLLGKEYTSGYPFVHNGRKNYDQFVNPSDKKINGAIDIFEVRDSIIDLSTSDMRIRGVKGHYQGGGIEATHRGGVKITDVREYKLPNQIESFEDSQDIFFGSESFPQAGVDIGSGTTGNKFGIPGIVGLTSYKMTFFEDKLQREDDTKYTILTDSQKLDLLKNSDKNQSEIGTRFKSSTCGLIFGESNALGTDSIAFGGMKK